MVLRHETLGVLVPRDEREIRDPQGRVGGLVDELKLAGHHRAHVAEHPVHEGTVAGRDEDEVPHHRFAGGEEGRTGIPAQGATQGTADLGFADLGPGQAGRTHGAGLLFEAIDALAGEGHPAGHAQGLDAAASIQGRR